MQTQEDSVLHKFERKVGEKVSEVGGESETFLEFANFCSFAKRIDTKVYFKSGKFYQIAIRKFS